MSPSSKLKEQILRLEQGFPQNWIYLEREVKFPIKDRENEGVKASQNFVGKSISEIFHKDLLDINIQKVTKIRPIIGANGAGKTTLIKFHVKDFMEQLAPNSNMFLFFDFKSVSDNAEEFWSIFIQNLIDQIYNDEEEQKFINLLINKIDASKRRAFLFKIFKNRSLVDNLLKLSSLDPNDQSIALEYFYGEEIKTKTISDLFYGLLKLALQLDFLVVIGFDEIQFLNEIDSSNSLLKLFLEKFVRYLMEKFSKERLYIIISCLENPRVQEWTKLKEESKNFETIVKNREIVLGNLTINEKNAIIKQVADKIGFEKKDQKIFQKKVKSSIQYYLPRELLRCIANVIDTMDYVGYTDYDIRQMYEEDARIQFKSVLEQKGFMHLEEGVKKIGGFDVDIYATGSTQRTGHIKKAFGEVTMTQRTRMKSKIEKFSNWLLRMNGREFKPNKGDFAFFVCPPGSITSAAKQVLDDNNIELYEFISPNIEKLQKLTKDKGEYAVEDNDVEKDLDVKKDIHFFIKETKYKLNDVPGIGPAKEKKLNQAGIHTIKDLLNCNVKIKAKEISGIGEVSLNKWKQAARQISN